MDGGVWGGGAALKSFESEQGSCQWTQQLKESNTNESTRTPAFDFHIQISRVTRVCEAASVTNVCVEGKDSVYVPALGGPTSGGKRRLHVL